MSIAPVALGVTWPTPSVVEPDSPRVVWRRQQSSFAVLGASWVLHPTGRWNSTTWPAQPTSTAYILNIDCFQWAVTLLFAQGKNGELFPLTNNGENFAMCVWTFHEHKMRWSLPKRLLIMNCSFSSNCLGLAVVRRAVWCLCSVKLRSDKCW